MKNLFAILFVSASLFTAAQTDYNKWAITLNVGSHDGMAPTAAYTRVYQFNYVKLGGRYMFNNRIGVMLDVSYDLFKFKNADYKTNYIKSMVYGVVNAGDLLRFDTWTDRIGLLVYGGAGISNMWQKDTIRNAPENTDPLFKGVDDMLAYTFGARPQVRLNDRFSINADLSFTFHARQNMQFDMQSKSKHGAIDGYFLNLSIGASYYIGKHKTHADWTPTEYGGKVEKVDNSKYDAYEQRIYQLEQLLLNKEEMPDTDGDGIPDEFDICPNDKGLFSDNGCPDTDGDGVDDSRDKCPDVRGVQENNGCPEIAKDVHEVMVKALKGVQFETGKSILLVRSNNVLDAVAHVMEEHPEYYLNVNGHTDDIGTPESNLILSNERADAVVKYLTSKGVDVNRIRSKGFGESEPKVSNKNKAGQAQNRRVEFNIVFE